MNFTDSFQDLNTTINQTNSLKNAKNNNKSNSQSLKFEIQTKEGENKMNITEILIIIVNISILILPIVMLIENLIKRNYKILNICILINIFAWVYLSYLWNIRNPGFWIKCDVRILNLIASLLFIASIITFLLQLKHKKGNKLLIMIAIIFVFYIIMTNDTTYEERTRVDTVSDKTIREYVLEEHIPYIAFLSIEVELFINLLDSHKIGKIESKKEEKKEE